MGAIGKRPESLAATYRYRPAIDLDGNGRRVLNHAEKRRRCLAQHIVIGIDDDGLGRNGINEKVHFDRHLRPGLIPGGHRQKMRAIGERIETVP